MTGSVLERSLLAVSRRLRRVRLLRRQSLLWIMLLIPGVIACRWLPPGDQLVSPSFLIVLTATCAGLVSARLLVRPPSLLETARLVEQRHPELNDVVLTAVRLSDSPDRQSSGTLSLMVLRRAEVLARRSRWGNVVTAGAIARWTLVSCLSFAAMVSGVVAAGRWPRSSSAAVLNVAADAVKSTPELSEALVVEPGDVELEQGTALTVAARFATTEPLQVVLQLTAETGETRLVEMAETVDDGVYAGRLEEVTGNGSYRVLYDRPELRGSQVETRNDGTTAAALTQTEPEGKSATFAVTTFVRPALEQLDAMVVPPEYTGRESQVIEDTVRLLVPEGSLVTLRLRLNKEGITSELRDPQGAVLVVPTTAEFPRVAETTLQVRRNQSWNLHLVDTDGRTGRDDEVISVRVIGNTAPEIRPTFPGRDTDVSALQEFLVEASVTDDFGILDYGVMFDLSGRSQQTVSLMTPANPADAAGSAAASDPASASGPALVPDEAAGARVAGPVKSATLSFRLDLEAMRAEPESLITYAFWADDHAADGSVRRTLSDLMFAEVRRFEEIFRESQQRGSPSANGQSASAADDLVKTQKEIISATWNTTRTEAERRASGTFADDVGVIAESQAAVAAMLNETTDRLGDDPQIVELIRAAAGEMNRARVLLEQVRDHTGETRLSEAIVPEQNACRHLLQLKAKVTQVGQQQGQGQGSGSDSTSQEKLQQLELTNEVTRYESEQQAQRQQSSDSQRTARLQVLNRLRELARRQQLLNERLRQLESELRVAESAVRREELERELKRLREEQRDLIRDADDVRERLAQSSEASPQSRQLQPSRQSRQSQPSRLQEQLDQARENMQRASQSLADGRLSEAVSEGTRAGRTMDEVQNEYRRQTASQFTDAMRELKNRAQQLSDQQEQLARQLAGETPGTKPDEPPSLRENAVRDTVPRQLAEQRDRLNEITDEASRIIEQAEQSEPLLSRQLYDVLRETRESKPLEALQAAEVLAGRRLWNQAQQAEEVARQGITRLARGIRQSADAVLGEETQALRRAGAELQELAQQLDEEIRSARSDAEPAAPGTPATESTAADARPDAAAAGSPSAAPFTKSDQDPTAVRNAEYTPAGDEASSGKSGGSSSESSRDLSALIRGGRLDEGENPSGDEHPSGGENRSGGRGAAGHSSGAAGARPLTGENFSQWSDRLRDVEEMLSDVDLRSRAAQVRDRARAMRADYRRHGREPQWDLVRSQLLGELQTLRLRISQELSRLESPGSMAPVDRDPIPEEFSELVQRYYELLGQQRRSLDDRERPDIPPSRK